MQRIALNAVVLLPLLGLFPGFCRADTPPEEWRSRLQAIILQLDHDDFPVREEARARLLEMTRDRTLRQPLANEIRRRLLQEQLSTEVRAALVDVSAKLPRAETVDTTVLNPASPEEIVGQLTADRASVRSAAAARFQALLSDPTQTDRVYRRLKAHFRSLPAADPLRGHFETQLNRARGAWLMTDAKHDEADAVKESAVTPVLDALTHGADAGNGGEARPSLDFLRIDLLDLIARDSIADSVKSAIEKRLAEELTPEVRAELTAILAWTRPSMVAEFWSNLDERAIGRRPLEFPLFVHSGIQHLLIGVPNHSPGAERPSHFDKISETSAHCVSGNALSPGDYPVGVFFPHPNFPDNAEFHLVNLPTARRRLAYEVSVLRPEGERLAEVSERTMNWYLARRVPLDVAELRSLEHFDPVAVSRGVGKLLLAMPDGRVDIGAVNSVVEPQSHHQFLCEALVSHSVKEVIPDLITAIEQGRFLPIENAGGRAFHWMVVLRVAEHDPWPDAEAYLKSLLARDDPLTLDKSVTLGANAAAVLLKRRGEDPLRHGLVPAPDGRLAQRGVELFRYRSTSSRETLLRSLDAAKPADKTAP